MTSNNLKLNVGCGNRKMHGYVNVDIREDLDPDVICDITRLSKTFSNADVIYACHVLEHFPFKESWFAKTTCTDVLRDWHQALRLGGTLRLAVPDIAAACAEYLDTGDIDQVRCLFWGGQKYDFDFHFNGWDFETLKNDLMSVGFTNVRTYDWRQTDHFYVDDYSQAYLPHMDKVSGRLMSLNVEATKT